MIRIKVLNLPQGLLFSGFVVIYTPPITTINMHPGLPRAETTNAEHAVCRQTSNEYLQRRYGRLYSPKASHASAAIHDKDEVVI